MIKETTRTVTIPSVEMVVEFDKKFYDSFMKEKGKAEQEIGREMSIGEFLMINTNNLLNIVNGLNHIIGEQKKTIDLFMATAGIKEVEQPEFPDGIKIPDGHMFG